MATLRLLLAADDGSLVDEMTMQLSEKLLPLIHRALSVTYSTEVCWQFGDSVPFSCSFKSTTQFLSNTMKPTNQP